MDKIDNKMFYLFRPPLNHIFDLSAYQKILFCGEQERYKGTIRKKLILCSFTIGFLVLVWIEHLLKLLINPTFHLPTLSTLVIKNSGIQDLMTPFFVVSLGFKLIY